jgi:integrase
MKLHFTDAAVKRLKLPAGESQQDFFETVIPGRSLILTLNRSGRHAWSVLFYERGKPRRRKLGWYGYSDAGFPELSPKQARQAAIDFDVAGYLSSGKVGSFTQVAEAWLQRHVRGRLRTEKEIERLLVKCVYPHWADRPFAEIRRGDVNLLLDRIEDERGARQADCVLTAVRSLMTWHQSRDENYTSPIVKGMKRDKRLPEQKTRDRVLDDDEIRGLWKALDGLDPTFAGIVKLCLLTAQRREKIVSMKWEDVVDGVWKIPTENREKGNAGTLVLPTMALEIIKSRPRINDSPYVFAASRSRKEKWPRFSAWSQRMGELNAALKIPHWTIHDLRRTARSLMARSGVLEHTAERVMGHKRPGVVGIYDRHSYQAEIAGAVGALAGLLAGLLEHTGADIVPMRQRKRQ